MSYGHRQRASALHKVLWFFAILNVTVLIGVLPLYRSQPKKLVVPAAAAQPEPAGVGKATSELEPPTFATRLRLKVKKKQPARWSLRQRRQEALGNEVLAAMPKAVEPAKRPEPVAITPKIKPAAAAPPQPVAVAVAVEKTVPAPPRPEPPKPAVILPPYEVLHLAQIKKGRTYGEVLVPSLTPGTPVQELKRVATTIARQEGLDSLVLYCTNEARRADYSMEYWDENPNALRQGLLGYVKRGRFKRAGPKDWGEVE